MRALYKAILFGIIAMWLGIVLLVAIGAGP